MTKNFIGRGIRSVPSHQIILKRPVVILLSIVTLIGVGAAQQVPNRTTNLADCLGEVIAPLGLQCVVFGRQFSSVGASISLSGSFGSPALGEELAANSQTESSFGVLRFQNSASFNIAGFPSFAVAITNAGFEDLVTIDFPPFRGQQGQLMVSYTLNGTVFLQGQAGAVVNVNALVSDPGGSNPQSSRVTYASSTSGLFTFPQVFHFTYGKPFVLGFSLFSQNGTVSPTQPASNERQFVRLVGTGTGIVDFSNTLVVVGMDVAASNGSRLPAPPTFASASGTQYSTDGVLKSFEHFFAHAELEHEEEGFGASGSFLLSPRSNGIDPLTQEVVIQVGDFSAVIPAGSFKSYKPGRFRFQGIVNGALLRISIRAHDDQQFSFRARARGASLKSTAEPLTIRFIVGDNGGKTESRDDFDD